MANKLIRLKPISIGTDNPEIDFGGQQNIQTIDGLVDGAGVAVDASQNVYVADSDQHIIFKYRPGSPSMVWAGTTGVAGTDDGQAGAAKFNTPTYMACDPSGNVWVVDSGNALIRRIDPNANVFTVAAITGIAGGDQIGGIAIDASGVIYLVDNG